MPSGASNGVVAIGNFGGENRMFSMANLQNCVATVLAEASGSGPKIESPVLALVAILVLATLVVLGVQDGSPVGSA